MGLLLSVLVVCVGVLEVLACVRHFQDGYLPLWTPHCAVTSGYTASYERWRKKPSDSCEFRSFDDVNGALYPAENVLSENCFAGSSNIHNGFAGKQAEKDGENICASTDLYCQQSKSYSGNGLSPSIDDHRKEVISCHNIADILASSLEPDDGELKLINKNIANVRPSDSIPDISEQNGKTKEALTDEFSSDLPSERNPVNISTQYHVMISHTQTESAVPLSDHELERTFSRDNGIEKYSISDKETDIENEIPALNVCAESYTSTCGVNNEGNCGEDSSDDILDVKTPTQNDDAVRLEENLEISSSRLCGESILDTAVRDTLLSAVEKLDSRVPVAETEPNILMSDSITERSVNAVPEPELMSSTQTEVQVPSDSVLDTLISSVLKLEDQIQPTSAEALIPSHLQTQEDKSIMGLVERDLSITAEILDKPESTVSSSRNESVDTTCLNNERRFQNSFVPHFLSEETSLTPVKVSSQYNVGISGGGLESRHSDACEQPISSPESFGVRKELSDWNIQTESGRCLSAECAEQRLGTGVRKGIEAFNSNFDNSCSGYDTGSGTDIQRSPLVPQDENVRNIIFEERPDNETSVSPEEDGTKHAVLDPSIAREHSSPNIQNEKETGITNEDTEEHVSESCLDSQTILTDSAVSRDELTPHDTGFPASGDVTQDSVHGESSNLQASSDISVTSLAVNTAVQLPVSVPPLSINTTLESPVSITPLPTDYQPSVSPPKVPSTPKRSKADISWPTFFPGTPVIKRPSVSFATPESSTNDDEFLRQYVEESTDLSCINIPDDNSTATESDSSASTSEGILLQSVGISERSDSLEEPDRIIYREKSPSGIVSGNDFSRKELKLHRRKSYKQKRYNSAVEIRTRDEEAEDRSFSENNPVLTRASSVREPKKPYRQLAKSSSFEDALLHDIKTDGVGEASIANTTEETSDVSIPEGRETEREETKHDQENFEETKETNDITDCLAISTERNESKFDESKPEEEEKWIEGNNTEGQKEDNKGDDDEDYSFGEEQSSSQQKSPPKEAFWLIFSGEYTKAMSKDWHSGHFCCWQCDESLTGQRYVLRDDHPYCIKCYESVFANLCEECNKTIGIDSKDLSYKDKHWHEACFLCNKCRVSLVDKQFGSKADKIYCGNCYDAQFASRCDGCGEIFRAGTKKMEYKTRQWHEKCFCCCVCKTAIGTKSFIPREQEIYCATCYEEKFATRCVKCNKIITSGGVTYKNEPWHRECFTCTHCNTSLAGQRFTSRDEKPYCAECFGELFAKRCTACSKPITGIGGTRFISFEDRHWHNDCFICASCKTSLVGRGFITDADDIICPECAKQKLM